MLIDSNLGLRSNGRVQFCQGQSLAAPNRSTESWTLHTVDCARRHGHANAGFGGRPPVFPPCGESATGRSSWVLRLELTGLNVVDRRRHAPSGRFRNPKQVTDARGLPQVYRGRARKTHHDVYDKDPGGGGGFRWLIGTCIAATIGAFVIAVVIIGSLESKPSFDNVMDRITDAQKPAPLPTHRRDLEKGLNWAMPKSERLEIASGALSARYTIHEQAQIRRNNRPSSKFALTCESSRAWRRCRRKTPMSFRRSIRSISMRPRRTCPAPAKTAGDDSANGRVAARKSSNCLGGIHCPAMMAKSSTRRKSRRSSTALTRRSSQSSQPRTMPSRPPVNCRAG